MKKSFIILFVINILTSISMKAETKVLIETSLGNITVCLYDETPKHRDNFIKLVEQGYFDGTLFHRVIKDFMIQGGDPDSKNAPSGKMLGSGGPGYTIPAEFVYPKYFHKKGALSAARQADQVNPQKASSGSQFYIVTGQVYDDAQFAQMEEQQLMSVKNAYFNQLATARQQEIQRMYMSGDQAGLNRLQDELIKQTEAHFAANPVEAFTPEQKQAYKTVGGTPFLDNQYTVFGEVVEGMDVVDKIQLVKTDGNDRPVSDVKMLKVTVIR